MQSTDLGKADLEILKNGLDYFTVQMLWPFFFRSIRDGMLP